MFTRRTATALLSYVVAFASYISSSKEKNLFLKQTKKKLCLSRASKRARKSRGRKVPDRREGAKTSTMLARGYWRCLGARIHEAALIETSLGLFKIIHLLHNYAILDIHMYRKVAKNCKNFV